MAPSCWVKHQLRCWRCLDLWRCDSHLSQQTLNEADSPVMLKENTQLRCMVWPRAQFQVTGRRSHPQGTALGMAGSTPFSPALSLCLLWALETWLSCWNWVTWDSSDLPRRERGDWQEPPQKQTPNALETHTHQHWLGPQHCTKSEGCDEEMDGEDNFW